MSPFSSLIMMLGTNAMIALGKLPNPATGKMMLQLDGAKLMIDMLEAVYERTRGNLSGEESQLLERTLSDLRLNYVTEMNRGRNPVSPAADTPYPTTGDGGIPDNVA